MSTGKDIKRKERKKKKSNARLGMLLITLAVLICGFAIGGVWYYTTQEYLLMAGEEQMTIGLHGIFEDPGVEARFGGKDVARKVHVQSDLDVDQPGTYTIHYSYGNFKASRTVKVLDEMQPQLKLKGDQRIRLRLGQEYQEPGFTARDEDGNSLKDKVRVSNTDFKRAGTYDVEYTVTDAQGRSTRQTRRVTVLPNTNYGSPGLPICMYHYVYDELNPPADVNSRYGNYISVQGLTEELNWLNEEGYYYPSWQEVRDYVDGRLLLPEKSIVITFDDGEKASLINGIPVMEAARVPWTSFLITSKNGEHKVKEYTSKYLTYQSHTHDMHRAGGVPGHRGIFPVISYEEGMADLKESIRILGHHDAFAYPYGDYSESSRQMLQDAGFLCAVTTQAGKAYPGMDPLLLPRVRMVQGQTLLRFQSVVAPPQPVQPLQ